MPERGPSVLERSELQRVRCRLQLARGNAEAGLVDMTDEDVERWTCWFAVDTEVRRGK